MFLKEKNKQKKPGVSVLTAKTLNIYLDIACQSMINIKLY